MTACLQIMAKRQRSSWISTAEGEGYEDVSTLQGPVTHLASPSRLFLWKCTQNGAYYIVKPETRQQLVQNTACIRRKRNSSCVRIFQPHPCRITHI